jgi:hypothetical protein
MLFHYIIPSLFDLKTFSPPSPRGESPWISFVVLCGLAVVHSLTVYDIYGLKPCLWFAGDYRYPRFIL